MNILFTGGKGQLGQCFRDLANQYPEWNFIFTDYEELDITSARSVKRFFQENTIHWCVNCAAYTAVDKAESEPEKARRINVRGAAHLADACAAAGIPMTHFSTDYVYHTAQNTPFKEGDKVSPKSVYARTKLAGDLAVRRRHPLSMVVRTSWVYAPHSHNFVRTMLRLGAERPELSVVFDQIGSPTYAPDLAEAVLQVIGQVSDGRKKAEDIAGIWHYSNEGATSWYDFAVAIFEMSGLACKVRPIETAQYPTPAARPPYSVLNKSKFKTAFGLDIPHWREALARCIRAIQ